MCNDVQKNKQKYRTRLHYGSRCLFDVVVEEHRRHRAHQRVLRCVAQPKPNQYIAASTNSLFLLASTQPAARASTGALVTMYRRRQQQWLQREDVGATMTMQR